MRFRIFLLFLVLLAACSPKSTIGVLVPIPSLPAAALVGETFMAAMVPAQVEPLPTSVSGIQTPGFNETPTAEITLTGSPIINEIDASLPQTPHSGGMLCQQCHIVEAGLITRQLAWLDEKAGLAERISNPQEICLKCHDHLSVTSTVMLQHPGFECIYCHDSHHPQPTCAESACH